MSWILFPQSGGTYGVGYYTPSGVLVTIDTGLTLTDAKAQVWGLNGGGTTAPA